MSRKCSCAPQGGTNHRDTEAQRRTTERICLRPCDSVVNLGTDIYREAPAETTAGLCPAGRPKAAVPTWVAAVTGRGTETCSCTACRSLLSSGWSWRYGPVIACDASSALKRM